MTDLHQHLSSIAGIIAEPARAKILCCLMDGRAYTATELSTVAEVSASTTSAHLAKLESKGFISLIKQGRYRYYRLASEEIAKTLETLMNVTINIQSQKSIKSSTPFALRLSRTCYNHLAGKIAVEIMAHCLKEQWIEGEEEYLLTPKGFAQLQKIGFKPQSNPKIDSSIPKMIAHNCLDWSERKFHLAGTLATQLLLLFEQQKWIERYPQTREIIWSTQGKVALKRYFNIDYEKILTTKKP